jgi:hypothetical protein
MYHRRYIMFMHVLYVFIRDRHPVTPRTLDSACRETESLYMHTVLDNMHTQKIYDV